ncbi:pentapeptide repeat-containing protein [Methylophilaceae bacterium]|nr:pentapeptide repeat-containing protein [Methylophilaceae bacterium]
MKKLITFMFMSLSFSAFSEEFNNFCTTSLSEGNFHVTNCSVNEKVDGKTYCFGNKVAKDIFLENPQEVIKKAEQFYKASFNDERKKITQEEVDNILNNEPDCDLSNLDVGYLNFSGKDLTHCKMVNISFFGADFRGANLSGANLQRAYLNLARLEETNFNGANLSMATIFQPIFGNTNFHKAN